MIKDLLKKYLNGELEEQQLDELGASVDKIKNDREIEEVIRETWDEAANKPLESESLARITSKVISRVRETPKRTTLKFGIFRSAAILLALVGISLFVYKMVGTPTSQELVYRTGNSENLQIELPDLSKVTLSANSRLTYDHAAMKSGLREVELEGEAYFEIEKKLNNQTFKVKTRDLTISVHGTEFNVNSHWNQTEVVLEGGVVSLDLHEKNTDEITMKPGDLVSYSAGKKGNIIRESLTETRMHTSWKEGVLFFENTPLKKVFKRLESTYGLNIEADEQEIGDDPMTTAIPIDNLDQVLAILRGFTNYEYRLTDRLLSVNSK